MSQGAPILVVMDSSAEDQMNREADRDLGALVAVLDGQGHFDQADLVESGSLVYQEIFNPNGSWEDPQTGFDVSLAVDPLHYPLVTDEAMKVIRETLEAMHESRWCFLGEVKVRPMPVAADWRDLRRAARLSPEGRTAMNQGGYKPVSTLRQWDGLKFGSEEEILVFKALKAKQKSLPPELSLGIMPGAALVTAEKRFWPDFVVTYRNRAGGIEVDGPHHHGRAAADRSRENFLTDSGLAWVDRITVEDVTTPDEVAGFIDRFLARLAVK